LPFLPNLGTGAPNMAPTVLKLSIPNNYYIILFEVNVSLQSFKLPTVHVLYCLFMRK